MSNFFESLTKIVFELNNALSQVANKTADGSGAEFANLYGAAAAAAAVTTTTSSSTIIGGSWSHDSIVIPSLLIQQPASVSKSPRYFQQPNLSKFNTPPSPVFYDHYNDSEAASLTNVGMLPKFVLVSSNLSNFYANHSATTYGGGGDVFQETLMQNFWHILVPSDMGMWEMMVHIMLLIMCFLIGGITVFLNAVVVRCFFKERSVRTPSNYFITSLATTDLAIGLISLPVYTMYLILEEKWPFGSWFCDIWLVIDYTLCLVSQYTVFAITVDRFFSVRFPALYHRWLTKRRAGSAIFFIWSLSAVVFASTIIGWQFFVGERTVPDDQCYVQFISSPFFNMIFVIGYFWSTLVVIVILYAQIVVIVWRRSQRTRKITEATLKTLRLSVSPDGRNHRLAPNLSSLIGSSPDEGDFMASRTKQGIFAGGFLASMALRLTRHEHAGSSTTAESTTDGSSLPKCSQSVGSPVSPPENGPLLLRASWDGSRTTTTTSLKQNNSCQQPDGEDLTPAKRLSQLSPHNGTTSSHIDEEEELEAEEETHRRCHQTTAGHNNSSDDDEHVAEVSPGHGDNVSSEALAQAVDLLTSDTVRGGVRRPSIVCKQLLSFRRIRDKQMRRTFLMISLILGVFVLTWSPYHILAIVKGFCNDCVPKSLYNLAYWFCYLNSPINPICYGLLNKKIRDAFYRVLHMKNRQRKNGTLKALIPNRPCN